MERNKRKIGRWLGVLAAVLVPAIATAALTIPNTFSAGTVIKSADVNANFAAVATAVSADQSAVAALQTAVTNLQTTVTSLQSTVTSQASTIASLQSTVAASPQIVAFAHFDGSKVVTFGGSATTSAVGSPGGPAVLTFTGKYPSSIAANKVQILASAEAYDFTALDAYVVGTPTATTIQIGVYAWLTSNTSYYGYQDNAPFYVALLVSP